MISEISYLFGRENHESWTRLWGKKFVVGYVGLRTSGTIVALHFNSLHISLLRGPTEGAVRELT